MLNNKGFTVIELLVCLAVAGVVGCFMYFVGTLPALLAIFIVVLTIGNVWFYRDNRKLHDEITYVYDRNEERAKTYNDNFELFQEFINKHVKKEDLNDGLNAE
jgi:prepilin-type N-terminal cleavage/methylation domain-containing protein